MVPQESCRDRSPGSPGGGEVVELDGSGCCAIPGLVDCHTHAAFGGDRVEEFSLRAAGAGYAIAYLCLTVAVLAPLVWLLRRKRAKDAEKKD